MLLFAMAEMSKNFAYGPFYMSMNDNVFSLKPLQEQPDALDGERSRETQSTPASSQPSMCLLSPPQERSGRETPISVDSIPLEWDHTGDVGGSSSHDEEEDAAFFSALSGKYVYKCFDYQAKFAKFSVWFVLRRAYYIDLVPVDTDFYQSATEQCCAPVNYKKKKRQPADATASFNHLLPVLCPLAYHLRLRHTAALAIHFLSLQI